MDCPQTSLARRRKTVSVALCLLLLVTQSGCKVLIGTIYALRGKDMTKCELEVATGDTLRGKDKKVVVLCTVPDGARAEYGGLNYDIITNVTRSLEAHEIRVADSQKVATWLDDHSTDLTDLQLTEVAKKFKCNYVMLLNLTQFSFREPGSPNMYRGRTHGFISVAKVEEVNGTPKARTIFRTVYDTTYPANQPIPADQEAEKSFKLKYVQQVSDEISRRFHDHRPEDSI